jgi:hypothetical protein
VPVGVTEGVDVVVVVDVGVGVSVPVSVRVGGNTWLSVGGTAVRVTGKVPVWVGVTVGTGAAVPTKSQNEGRVPGSVVHAVRSEIRIRHTRMLR